MPRRKRTELLSEIRQYTDDVQLATIIEEADTSDDSYRVLAKRAKELCEQSASASAVEAVETDEPALVSQGISVTEKLGRVFETSSRQWQEEPIGWIVSRTIDTGTWYAGRTLQWEIHSRTVPHFETREEALECARFMADQIRAMDREEDSDVVNVALLHPTVPYVRNGSKGNSSRAVTINLDGALIDVLENIHKAIRSRNLEHNGRVLHGYPDVIRYLLRQIQLQAE